MDYIDGSIYLYISTRTYYSSHFCSFSMICDCQVLSHVFFFKCQCQSLMFFQHSVCAECRGSLVCYSTACLSSQCSPMGVSWERDKPRHVCMRVGALTGVRSISSLTFIHSQAISHYYPNHLVYVSWQHPCLSVSTSMFLYSPMQSTSLSLSLCSQNLLHHSCSCVPSPLALPFFCLLIDSV